MFVGDDCEHRQHFAIAFERVDIDEVLAVRKPVVASRPHEVRHARCREHVM